MQKREKAFAFPPLYACTLSLVNNPVLDRIESQLLSELRVRDADQLLCTCRQIFAEQIDAAVLGHDILHIGAQRIHCGACRQIQDDLRLQLAVLAQCRRQRNERFAALGL